MGEGRAEEAWWLVSGPRGWGVGLEWVSANVSYPAAQPPSEWRRLGRSRMKPCPYAFSRISLLPSPSFLFLLTPSLPTSPYLANGVSSSSLFRHHCVRSILWELHYSCKLRYGTHFLVKTFPAVASSWTKALATVYTQCTRVTRAVQPHCSPPCPPELDRHIPC